MPTSKNDLNLLPVLLDVETTATLLGVSPRYVRFMCKRGMLRAKMVGHKWRINKWSALEFAGLEEL